MIPYPQIVKIGHVIILKPHHLLQKKRHTHGSGGHVIKEKTLSEIYFDWLVKIENAWKSGVATYISKDDSIAIMWLQRFMDVTGWYEQGGSAPTNHSGSYE